MSNYSKSGLEQLKFSRGSKIYSKGEKAFFAYYVHSGKVNIYSPGGLLLGQIGEGEIFGERGPSLSESRSVTAEAASNCILFPISEKTIKEKIEKADPVLRAMLRSLLIRLNDMNVKGEDFWRNLNIMTSLSEKSDK
jgi:CRP-like cAMP-binding protein